MLTNYGESVYEIQPVYNEQYRQRDVDHPLSSHTWSRFSTDANGGAYITQCAL